MEHRFPVQAKGLLYMRSHDETVGVWHVADSTCFDTFLTHEDGINTIVVNQDDRCVLICSSVGAVKIRRMVYNERSHTLTMRLWFQESPVNVLALSSSLDNYFLYSGSSDGTIDFWEKEMASYRLSHAEFLQGHRFVVLCLEVIDFWEKEMASHRFSHAEFLQGHRFVVLCLEVIDFLEKEMASYRFSHAEFLQGHRFTVLCLEAIDRLVFSGSEDAILRIWKQEEGSCIHRCLTVMDGHRGAVRCLAVCTKMDKVVEGYLVYSTSLAQTFEVWRIKVLPDEKVLYLGKAEEGSVNDDHNLVIKDGLVYHYYETNPVLSPS